MATDNKKRRLITSFHNLTAEQQADFIEGYYAEGKQFGDGLMYTMPFSKSTEVMYYNKTLDERIQTLVDNASVDYIPGTTHKYNNTNFGVLSMIVEVISGKTFEEYIKDLYAQYDIKDICGGKNNESQKLKNEVSYYGQDGKNAYGNDVENGIGAGVQHFRTLSRRDGDLRGRGLRRTVPRRDRGYSL